MHDKGWFTARDAELIPATIDDIELLQCSTLALARIAASDSFPNPTDMLLVLALFPWDSSQNSDRDCVTICWIHVIRDPQGLGAPDPAPQAPK